MRGRFFKSMTFVACCVWGGLAYAAIPFLLFYGFIGETSPVKTMDAAWFFMVVLFFTGWGFARARLSYVDTAAGGATPGQLVKSTLALVSLPLLVLLGAGIGGFLGLVLGSILGLLIGAPAGGGLGYLAYMVLWGTFAKSPFKKRPETYDR